jgi:hypothetical protein
VESTERAERVVSRELLTIAQLKEAWLRSEPVEFGDPILAHIKLTRHAMFFPLGFPVSVTTNSLAVLEAADESWGSFVRQFNTDPINLQIAVFEGEFRTCPPTPVCHMRDHVVTNIADADNFAVSDLSKLSATIWVTEAAIQHRDYFRYFFLESAAMSCINSGHTTAIHAACVALDDKAILLCGDSGAGKTTLSYACARAGWTYVTDDGSYLVHGEADRLVAGNCRQVRFRPSAEALFPDLRGRDVMQRAGVGKPSIEMQINVDDAIRVSTTAKARYLVFLQRNVEDEELTPFPRAVARMYLWQRVQCMPYQTSRHLQAIDALLQGETYELRYNSLDWAIARLTRLVREGR